jgi:hypothetical protein
MRRQQSALNIFLTRLSVQEKHIHLYELSKAIRVCTRCLSISQVHQMLGYSSKDIRSTLPFDLSTKSSTDHQKATIPKMELFYEILMLAAPSPPLFKHLLVPMEEIK